jgi:hypothetical protein
LSLVDRWMWCVYSSVFRQIIGIGPGVPEGYVATGGVSTTHFILT